MKILSSSRALSLAALLMAAGGCSQSFQDAASEPRAETLPRYVVGVDRDFPPYSFVDSNGRIAGFLPYEEQTRVPRDHAAHKGLSSAERFRLKLCMTLRLAYLSLLS